MVNSCIGGSIPKSLVDLSSLKVLELATLHNCQSEHYLRSSIPNAISQLQSLEKLRLSFSGLYGTVPLSLPGLTKLRYLELSSPTHGALSQLSGNLPSLNPLQNLEVLRLQNNMLWGPAPAVPWNPSMPYLRELTVNNSINNNMDITTIVSKAPYLEELNLKDSSVRLDITALRNCTLLKKLELSSTTLSISGDIGDWFWKLNNLEYISLENTRIPGSIGPGIADFSRLRYIDISNTRMTGTIPPEIGSCQALETFLARRVALSHPLPDSLGDLASLDAIDITGMLKSTSLNATIPSTLGNLSLLTSLTCSSCSLHGTIPASLANLSLIRAVRLDDNELTGTIPAFSGLDMIIDLQFNRLIGTIPEPVARNSMMLVLRNNHLGPFLDTNAFSPSSLFFTLDLSHNDFHAPLPEVTYRTSITRHSVKLSYNRFYGSIPRSYAKHMLVYLDHNELNGTLDDLFAETVSATTELHIDYNNISGSLFGLFRWQQLVTFVIAGNQFDSLPMIAHSLEVFNGADNKFTDVGFNNFVSSAQQGSLQYLDLSGNLLPPHTAVDRLLVLNISYISLANNQLAGTYPHFTGWNLNEGLELSNNQFTGTFPIERYPRLRTLKLANNSFSGNLDVHACPRMTNMDISNNNFQIDISQFSQLPFLLTARAQNNQLYGALVLDALPNLQLADFSNTSLNVLPDFTSIDLLYKSYALESLNIANNPNMGQVRLNETKSSLAPTNTSSPSRDFPSTMRCSTLAFSNRDDRTFIFDESLFYYAQCYCDSTHFGAAGLSCLPCPNLGVNSCGGDKLNVSRSFYTYPILDVEKNAVVRLETESCEVLGGSPAVATNCHGLILQSDQDPFRHFPSITSGEIDRAQCDDGSTGRLCSKCVCDLDGLSSEDDPNYLRTSSNRLRAACYYEGNAGTCRRCSTTFRPSQYVPLVLCCALILLTALTALMFVVLRSRRSFSTKQWLELPVFKRFFYRLQYVTTLGNVTILITFVQLLIEFTHWDNSLRGVLMLVLNGRGEGIGLRCLFPFLANPMASQLVQLSVPWIGVGFVGASVTLAALINSIIDRKSAQRAQEANGFSEADSEADALLGGSGPSGTTASEVKVEYPAFALFTSVSISVLKFFYFGTALAAHSYLFSETQHGTGLKFVQNQPWLLYSQASNVIYTSIPSVIVFDLVFPLLFVYLCWRVRHVYSSPAVQIYFGTLFETFNPQCFWWEMVNVLRKLSIALALRGIPSSDALQGSVVISVLVGTHLIQLTLRPWRRRIENFADSASTVLLISALIASRITNAVHYQEVIYYILALSIAFAVMSVGAIAYQTFTGRPDYVKRRLNRGDHKNLDINGTSINASPSFSETDNEFTELPEDSEPLLRRAVEHPTSVNSEEEM